MRASQKTFPVHWAVLIGPHWIENQIPGSSSRRCSSFCKNFLVTVFKIVFTCPRHPVIPPEVKSAFGRFWALGVQMHLSQVVVEFRDLL